jgi:hypothetical protein
MPQGGVAVVEQRICSGGTTGRGVLGLGAATAEWGGADGATGVFKGRSQGSRVRLGKGIPGGFAGDLGGPFRGEDDPARRARWSVGAGVGALLRLTGGGH